MTEAELIKKIKELRQIKPRKSWVVLTKKQIFNEPEKQSEISWVTVLRWLFQFKPVYAGIFTILIVFGLFISAQSSLPGDLLYSLKKITEMSQAAFASADEKPKINLELTYKRLEELNKIAQGNETKRLAPAISEFQTNISQVAKDLVKVKKINKEIVAQTKKIEENKNKVEKVLATKIETEEYDNVLAQLIENQIKELEGVSLTETQKQALQSAQENFKAGNYSEALEEIFNLNQR